MTRCRRTRRARGCAGSRPTLALSGAVSSRPQIRSPAPRSPSCSGRPRRARPPPPRPSLCVRRSYLTRARARTPFALGAPVDQGNPGTSASGPGEVQPGPAQEGHAGGTQSAAEARDRAAHQGRAGSVRMRMCALAVPSRCPSIGRAALGVQEARQKAQEERDEQARAARERRWPVLASAQLRVVRLQIRQLLEAKEEALREALSNQEVNLTEAAKTALAAAHRQREEENKEREAQLAQLLAEKERAEQEKEQLRQVRARVRAAARGSADNGRRLRSAAGGQGGRSPRGAPARRRGAAAARGPTQRSATTLLCCTDTLRLALRRTAPSSAQALPPQATCLRGPRTDRSRRPSSLITAPRTSRRVHCCACERACVRGPTCAPVADRLRGAACSGAGGAQRVGALPALHGDCGPGAFRRPVGPPGTSRERGVSADELAHAAAVAAALAPPRSTCCWMP